MKLKFISNMLEKRWLFQKVSFIESLSLIKVFESPLRSSPLFSLSYHVWINGFGIFKFRIKTLIFQINFYWPLQTFLGIGIFWKWLFVFKSCVASGFHPISQSWGREGKFFWNRIFYRERFSDDAITSIDKLKKHQFNHSGHERSRHRLGMGRTNVSPLPCR